MYLAIYITSSENMYFFNDPNVTCFQIFTIVSRE